MNVGLDAFRQFAAEDGSVGVPPLEGRLIAAVSAAILAAARRMRQHGDDRLAVIVRLRGKAKGRKKENLATV